MLLAFLHWDELTLSFGMLGLAGILYILARHRRLLPASRLDALLEIRFILLFWMINLCLSLPYFFLLRLGNEAIDYAFMAIAIPAAFAGSWFGSRFWQRRLPSLS